MERLSKDVFVLKERSSVRVYIHTNQHKDIYMYLFVSQTKMKNLDLFFLLLRLRL